MKERGSAGLQQSAGHHREWPAAADVGVEASRMPTTGLRRVLQALAVGLRRVLSTPVVGPRRVLQAPTAGLRTAPRAAGAGRCWGCGRGQRLSYGPPWAHYLGGYQDRLLGGPLGLPGLCHTAPDGVRRKDYGGEVLG
jgi:hypothetical protein